MRKSKLLRIAILVILLLGIYLFVQGGPLFVKQAPPAPQPPAEGKAEPPAVVSPPAQQPVSSGGGGQGQSDSMALEHSPRSVDTSQTNTDYSYSIRNEKKKEYLVLPGVTYVPKEGVNIKTAVPDETIHLSRDHSYHSDYQVLWQKKY